MTDDSFPAAAQVGEILAGTVAEVTPHGVVVRLDNFAGDPVGFIDSHNYSWRFSRQPSADDTLQLGDRVSGEVIAVDQPGRRVTLSRAATEHPQLWAFLKALHRGQRMSGTVAAIESFGVFVDLDDGPKHPAFPGVGFITIPELSWRSFEDTFAIVAIGQRVTCEVLAFDTYNGEARLSLRATEPDPFQDFARTVRVGQILRGPVTKLVPFGAFVRVTDAVEGLIHLSKLSPTPIETPDQAVRVGDEVTVEITEIDTIRRRLSLSRHH
ncbi:S1 RNA-binding domain-containing protein [Actinoplanes sp. L3-i22]|uniref:S1 RNA-binding domain-containing protein n=1 Tax=Actinoplanes sp. L3-i22 TaxID=2836373 RepID=UPI001C752B9B|nr:S1 RNA-binding domain-containing protein [Actinoplanes sp. L3-i22]BCY11723.1 hypothetical protein L3i22_068110 [Actinoplanes sp. L3-i22]